MDELLKMCGTLQNLCDLLNSRGQTQYDFVDWVFGFVIFADHEKVCDGNFSNVLQYLADKFN